MNAEERARRWFDDVYGRRVSTGEIGMAALTALLEEHEKEVAAAEREACAVVAEDKAGELEACYEPDIVSALIRARR